MINYDPVTNLQHFPVSGGMKRYGLNPFGAPLYRVVFAPSRRYLVCGEVAQWLPLYKRLGNVFVMERWLPAEQYAGASRTEWDQHLLILGPWPERGEYELCHVFDVAGPSDCNIQQLITYIEAGRNIPFAQTLEFNRKQAEAEETSRRNQATDIIKNQLPAFGCRIFSGGSVSRRNLKEVAPLKHSAEELGLPTTPGASSTGDQVTRLIGSAA